MQNQAYLVPVWGEHRFSLCLYQRCVLQGHLWLLGFSLLIWTEKDNVGHLLLQEGSRQVQRAVYQGLGLGQEVEVEVLQARSDGARRDERSKQNFQTRHCPCPCLSKYTNTSNTTSWTNKGHLMIYTFFIFTNLVEIYHCPKIIYHNSTLSLMLLGWVSRRFVRTKAPTIQGSCINHVIADAQWANSGS